MQSSQTVGEVKDHIITLKEGLEKERLTLVYKGRILKNEQKVEELNLTDGQTVHLVNKPAKAATPSAPTPAASTGTGATGAAGAGAGAGAAGANPFAAMGGMPGMMSGGGPSGMGGLNMDMSQISEMMNNPMMQSMMQNMMSDPNTM